VITGFVDRFETAIQIRNRTPNQRRSGYRRLVLNTFEPDMLKFLGGEAIRKFLLVGG